MSTWLERTDHLADHFKSGVTMASWQGDWGFDASVIPLVETAIPPGMILMTCSLKAMHTDITQTSSIGKEVLSSP